MRKIIGIGETVLDILFRDNRAYQSVPGGSTFNSMISLGRMGVPVTFISELGDDRVGHLVCDFLKDNGVCSEYISLYPETQSPISLAFLDEHCNADYCFYRQPFAEQPDFDRPEIEKDDIILFGSYYALNPETRYKVSEVLAEARRKEAIIYYDVNFRRNHVNEAIRLTGNLIENFEYADIIRGSEEDFELLYRLKDGNKVFKSKTEFYCPRLLYTRGAEGVDLFAGSFTKHYSSHAVSVVSTIGAGDNFNAGILFGLLKYRVRRDDLPQLTERDWDDIIHCGLLFSQEVCQLTDNYIRWEFAEQLKK